MTEKPSWEGRYYEDYEAGGDGTAIRLRPLRSPRRTTFGSALLTIEHEDRFTSTVTLAKETPFGKPSSTAV